MITCEDILEGCKKCIHYSVCSSFSPEWFLYNHKENCKDFKDKTRYVELPCKVGDTVYCVSQYGGLRVDWHIFPATVKAFYLEKVMFLRCESKDLTDKSNYYLEFGKTVFLTREEAEQALKERERV